MQQAGERELKVKSGADRTDHLIDETAVIEIVGRALELEENGTTPDLLELAGGDEALAAAASSAFETAHRLPELQAKAAGSESWIGRMFADRYRLIKRIGAGSMGVVYEAFDQELGRAVAIKVLRSGLLEREESAARFSREAEVLASIHHRGVVTLHDRGETPEGEVFLVMERLDGMSLADVLEEIQAAGPDIDQKDTVWIARRLGLDELREPSYIRAAVHWIADLAAGLQSVHDAGCFHRDIKPSNVFLCSDGQPVLLDFGIAARLDDARLTRESSALGTPAYLAPESLEQDNAPSALKDVYGLAATLYHLITRRAPFEGSPSQVLTALATREPTHPSTLRPGLPRDLQAILERGMARNPASRYATASELEADLRAFLDYRPVTARPTTVVGRFLRQTLRSRLVQGATAAALVIAAVTFGGSVRAGWKSDRQERYEEAYSHVLPNTQLSEYMASRVHALPESNAQQLAALDLCVSLASSPIPAQLLRAAFHLDHGAPALAASDMAAVAAVSGPYARALTSRFEALPSDAAGVEALNLDDLPDPRGTADHFVKTFQSLRDPEVTVQLEGMAALREPMFDDFVPAEEFRLIYRPGADGIMRESMPDDERARKALVLQEDVLRFEERKGRRSAVSRHLIGLCLTLQNQWGAALEVLDEAIELAPSATSPRENAALCALRLGDHERVLAYVQPMIARLPHYADPYDLWIRSLLEQGRLDEAEELLERTPYSSNNKDVIRKFWRQADILSLRAMEAESSGDRDTAVQSAERAAAMYAQLAEVKKPWTPTSLSLLAEGVLHGDPNRVFDGMLLGMSENPIHTARIQNALEHMPEALDSENIEHLREHLEALHQFLGKPARIQQPRPGAEEQ